MSKLRKDELHLSLRQDKALRSKDVTGTIRLEPSTKISAYRHLGWSDHWDAIPTFWWDIQFQYINFHLETHLARC